ncbi:WD repeat-containing protein [Cryptosporidium felis]|nr:WD repeat-containing protein [Cryptosporidium felis]
MYFNKLEKKALVIEKAYSGTPYIGYNLESPKHSTKNDNKTYIALSNLNARNCHVEILVYDCENNEFEIGYLYDQIFSPVGGVHWMPRKNLRLDENILGIASDSIKLFKEGNLICDLRINDLEPNSMRIENVYNPRYTKITSFAFSEYCEGDIISTTFDGRCIFWSIEHSESKAVLEADIFENSLTEYKNRVISNTSQMEDFTLMDVCFGHSKDNVLIGVNNGLAVSMDLRSPFKHSTSLLTDCILGWNTTPNQRFPHVKLCCVRDSNFFCRSMVSQGLVEIFDIRKTCGPLYRINSPEKHMVSIESNNSEELLLAYSDGEIQTLNISKETYSSKNPFQTNSETFSFSSLDISRRVDSFIGISSICSQNRTGIKIFKFVTS